MMAMDFVDWNNETVKTAEKAAKEADQIVVIKTINVSPPSALFLVGVTSEILRVKHSWNTEPTHTTVRNTS